MENYHKLFHIKNKLELLKLPSRTGQLVSSKHLRNVDKMEITNGRIVSLGILLIISEKQEHIASLAPSFFDNDVSM